MNKLLCLILALVTASGLAAQDLRNDMFGTRTAGYEPDGSKRGVVLTELDPRLRPFYHGVASGDPTESGVILWTRVTPEGGDNSVVVSYKVATDPELTNIITSGSSLATSVNDFCVKVDQTGLQPGTVYYYGFTAYGRNSLTGRTRTLPVGGYEHARFAVVTCSNYPAGFFNAYGRIAERNDIDAVLHMGDYIYEYDADTTSYGGATGAALDRRNEPDAELIQLADYRTRYAQYRTDPDLQRLHQQHPMIHIWDDHESANDSYRDGAQNHNDGEGLWSDRKATSMRVHSEWMPVRRTPADPLYRSFRFGDLVDVAMLDTRLEGRDKQVNGVYDGAPQSSRDSLNDPTRKIMSSTQYEWLTGWIDGSNATWRLISSQVLFTPIDPNPVDTTYLFNALGPVLASLLRPRIPELQAIFDAVYLGDVWNNYPAQRDALASFIRQNRNEKNIVVSGDFHVAMAMGGNWSTGQLGLCEFMTPSISAANFDENLGSDPIIGPLSPVLIRTIDTTLKQNSKELMWQELEDHGYIIVDILRDRVHCDWFFVDTILTRSSRESWRIGFESQGDGGLSVTSAAAPGKNVQDAPTPIDPPLSTSVDEAVNSNVIVIGFGPNPASNAMYISFTSKVEGKAVASIVDMKGAMMGMVENIDVFAGLNSLMLDLRSMPVGSYHVVLELAGTRQSIPIVIQR